MCRLLGIVANQSTNFRFTLKEGGHSNLESLSSEHKSGWGVAYRRNGGWIVKKSPLQAMKDSKFSEASIEADGKVLIGHIRKASSGDPKMENTHPFEMHGWVFAHNGTITEKEKLFDMVSKDIQGMIVGDTDSERYFGVLLSALIEAGLSPGAAPTQVAEVLAATLTSKISECKGNGFNFLLSDGSNVYAFRKGRDLYSLMRDSEIADVESFESKDVRVLVGEKAKRGEKAVLIASEKLTHGEAWTEVPESSLIWVVAEPAVHSMKVEF